MKTQIKQEADQKTEEVQLAQGKISRLEKARNDLETQLENLAKTKNLSEQELAELRETSLSVENRLKLEREDFEKTQTSLEEAIKTKNKQIEDLTAQLLQSQLQVQTIEKDAVENVAVKDGLVNNLRRDLENAKAEFDEYKKSQARIKLNRKSSIFFCTELEKAYFCFQPVF